ncbi:MAG: histidine ammonia-lyase, partial [Pseudomonadota bacterium]|nr:histidine ammonia-lyase [Pseudomonadota bacterium]
MAGKSYTASLTLGLEGLGFDTLRAFDRDRPDIRLGAAARERMARSRAVIEARISSGARTYGVNTGFGSMADRPISAADLAELQRRLIVSTAAGTGPLMGEREVRRMMLLKLNALATGFSGARPELADALIALLNAGIVPAVPVKGSVGASGDLAPLAHMGAALIGVGEVRLNGKALSAAEAIRRRGLVPFVLAPKEGLAIVNGTQASTSLAISGLFAAEAIFAAAVVAGALSLEAALGQDMAFDDRLHRARGQSGQRVVAKVYGDLIDGSAIRLIARREGRLQDPYCLRCQPQVMGACLDQMRHAAAILAAEINAWTDNPLVDAETGDILYGGNFHAEPVALAADSLALAIAETGAMSERRIALLTDANQSKLPAFLVKETGLDSGFMVAQVTAASLVSENKSLAHPASVDSIPTVANHEDFVSMATFAARRLEDMADNAAAIVAIELLAAAQGIEFRRPARSSRKLEDVVSAIRAQVPFYE